MNEQPAWPRKAREMHNHHHNSEAWNQFRFRPDDIVVATYAKSGTTWMQQIVSQLVLGPDADLPTSELSPWLDLRVPPTEVKLAALEAQTHRRIIKTHLPVDALVYAPEARYIYVARDGRDVAWSMYNHHRSANAAWYGALNDSPGRVGPPIELPGDDIIAYYHDWIEKDGHPFWPFWDNVRSWWAIRDLPNLLMVHFADLKADLPGEVARVAAFLGIERSREDLDQVVAYSRFDFMKQHAAQVAPLGGVFWDGGAESFIYKGTNGRWHDLLSPADCAQYEQRARTELGDECARWLGQGRLAAVSGAAAASA